MDAGNKRVDGLVPKAFLCSAKAEAAITDELLQELSHFQMSLLASRDRLLWGHPGPRGHVPV